jgi:aryl-alcohol dehydrogenase-like predicted oxidoreductase
VAIVAYSPLGRGFLTGQYKSWDQFEDGDFRKTLPRFNEEVRGDLLSCRTNIG